MTRSALLVIAALMLSLAGPGARQSIPAQDGKKPSETPHHKHGNDRCAKACNDCQRICDACSHHCVHQVANGKKDHMKTLHTCQDCAEICSAAARIVARGGPFADLICQSCAEACARCGKACEAFPDDKMMKACAEECRRCEKECREMLKQWQGAKVPVPGVRNP